MAMALVASASAQAGRVGPLAAPLTINTGSLPTGVAGFHYETRLTAEGGQTPYQWRLSDGQMPPGFDLDAKTGILSGTPTSAGEFPLTVVLADSGTPRNEIERKYTLVITAALTIRWLQPHAVASEQIRGKLEVTNATGQPFDQTVIVPAVNEVGKAFALGYQHFTLAPGVTSPPISFESSMPFGTYVVHADAVGEVPANNTIYRARLETDPMVVKQP